MKRMIAFFFVTLAAVLAFGFCYFPLSAWKDVFLMPFVRKEPVSFTISQGQTAGDIARNLVKFQIASDKGNLIRLMTYFSMDRNMRPGLYKITPGPSWKVLSQIKRQSPEDFKATIIPGKPMMSFFKSKEVSLDLRKSLDDDFFPKAMVPFLPENPIFRPVFLMPETYRLPELTPECLVARASEEWWKNFGKNAASKEDLFDKGIIASLVEMESKKDSERGIIAGVILNRLKQGMALQIDATVIYAWKAAGKDIKRVLHEDLKIDDPYNTYINRGLPPGPICIPSKESWEAAFNPAKHQFLYYVADGKDGHIFSKTFKEHRKAITSVRGR